MVLGNLLATIEGLKATIDRHGSELRQSEALTRYALIDPLLRELGWDTADPAVVRPEYIDKSGRADYVLMGDGRDSKVAMIEAKKLAESLEQHVLQALTYCNSLGIKNMLITNGSEWRLYDAFRHAPLSDRIITTFNVRDDDAHAVALKALHLWRPNLSAGVITAPPERLEGGTEVAGAMATGPSRALHEAGPEQLTRTQAPPLVLAEDWRPLSEVATSVGEGSGRPTGLRLPNGTESSISAWRSVLRDIGSWLDNQGLLAGKAPLHTGGRGNRYLLNTEPMHRDGKGFTERFRTERGFYLETNYNAPNTVNNAVVLLEHCGVDPATVYLRFGG